MIPPLPLSAYVLNGSPLILRSPSLLDLGPIPFIVNVTAYYSDPISDRHGRLHPDEVPLTRVFRGGHPAGEGDPADERGRAGAREQ